MKKIKINFIGMSIRSTFDPNNNPILDILRKYYDVEVCDNPDYIFCGVLYPGGYFSNGIYNYYIKEYPCVRIMINGENLVPDFNHVDYAISNYPIQYYDRNLYFPCGIESFTSGKTTLFELQNKNRDYDTIILKEKCKFASFIASYESENNMRGDFFKALNARKHVDSAGSYLNNMANGEIVDWLNGTKEQFMKKCKFSLCFESNCHSGFISEKIVEAFSTDTIPIYYGSQTIKEIFNPKSFIFLDDYSNFDSAIEAILDIDGNDEKYMEMLRQPIFNDEMFCQKKKDELETFLCNIFDQPMDNAYRRARFGPPIIEEEFLIRSIDRAIRMDIEEIEYVPRCRLSEKEIAKEHLFSLPQKVFSSHFGQSRNENE